MNPIVVKFGGSSLATAGQFEKVAAIIRENPGRRYVVASAPGKRFSGDTKVTDLLYRCYDAACAGQDFAPVLDEIRQRFADIIFELQLQVDLTPDFAAIEAHLRTSPQRDYMASRGEYLNSKLLAAYLGFAFVDAAQMVLFRADGSFDAEATNTAIGHALVSIDRAVIPGFYGAMPDGTIHTFSRGGSDVTGSIVARAVGAELYENWTDVSGVLAADPRIIEHPHVVDYITYRELRELSYMGASVLHEDAVFPRQAAGGLHRSGAVSGTAGAGAAEECRPRAARHRTQAVLYQRRIPHRQAAVQQPHQSGVVRRSPGCTGRCRKAPFGH